MSYVPTYKKSDWKAICDRCGFLFKASQLKETWDGLYVDQACWEPRHPMDFQKGIKDDPSVPWTRPEGADTETGSSGWESTKTSVPSGTFDGSL